jgi:hypothetical protein
METIILVLLMGGMNLLAFLIGARTGQKVQKGEDIQLPTMNPVKIIDEFKDKKEADEQREIEKTNWDNINNYRGDSLGQKDFS